MSILPTDKDGHSNSRNAYGKLNDDKRQSGVDMCTDVQDKLLWILFR